MHQWEVAPSSDHHDDDDGDDDDGDDDDDDGDDDDDNVEEDSTDNMDDNEEPRLKICSYRLRTLAANSFNRFTSFSNIVKNHNHCPHHHDRLSPLTRS